MLKFRNPPECWGKVGRGKSNFQFLGLARLSIPGYMKTSFVFVLAFLQYLSTSITEANFQIFWKPESAQLYRRANT